MTVYVGGDSLCDSARRELARSGEKAGEFRVRLVCLEGTGTLAGAGAGARRATEDSTTVGFITAPGPQSRFSRSILDAAGIAQITTSSGAAGMSSLLRAIEQAGDGAGLRESVLQEVG